MDRKHEARTLDDRYIRNITLPAHGQQTTHYDALVPGLALRVSHGGAKTWIVQRTIDGKPSRYKIGRYPAFGVSAARDEARRIGQLIEEKKNPYTEAEIAQQQRRRDYEELRRKQQSTFATVRDERFFPEYVNSKKADGKTPRLRARSREAYERVLKREWFDDWETRPLAEISRADVRALLAHICTNHGGYMANQVLSLTRSMFNWAVSQDMLEVSPFNGVSRPAEQEDRERVLHERELFYLWRAFDASPTFARPLKILMLTAQRRSETAGMERVELENLDGDAPLWRIQKHRAKNNCAHAVPLSPLAVEILGPQPTKPGLVFTTNGKKPVAGFAKVKDDINARLSDEREAAPDPAIDSLLNDWRFHDFRRTAATCMAELGVSRDVVEAILNHVSGTRAGVAGIYNRSELLEERRIALELWAKYLQRVTAERMSDQAIAALRAELRTEYRRRLIGDIQQRPQLRIAA